MKKMLPFLYRAGYPFAIIFWFITRPSTEGVRCVVLHDDCVLLVKHSYGPREFTIPGGGLKAKENLVTAAAREVKEETGILIRSIKTIDTLYLTAEFKKDTVHIALAEATNKEIQIDGIEIIDAYWCPLAALPSELSPRLRQYLLALRDDRSLVDV